MNNSKISLPLCKRRSKKKTFYISPLWDAVYKAFNIMFGLDEDLCGENELSWWLEEAPQNEAKYWIDKKEYNVSDIDAFYNFLVGKNC